MVDEPVYSAEAERFWTLIPAMYRDADAGDWLFKRYLSAMLDRLGEVGDLYRRIDYISLNDGGAAGDTSDLTNPQTADLSWLPWLAQLVGVDLDPALSEQAQRDAIAYASSGWMAATKSAVAAAAKSALTGSRYAVVYDHSIATVGDGGEWDVLIVTRTSETPDIDAVLTAIVDKRAKPAGVTLHHLAYAATWAQVEAAYPTWADWAAAGSWRAIEETGL